MTTHQTPTGVLLIRAWTEGDGHRGLRVRVTSTVDVLGSQEVRTSTSSVEETLRIVGSWLEDLIAAGGDASDPTEAEPPA